MDFIKLNEQLKTILNESPKLTKKDTNVPVLLWVSKRMASHSARIKILNKRNYSNSWESQTSNDVLSISISDDPQIVSPKKLCFRT